MPQPAAPRRPSLAASAGPAWTVADLALATGGRLLGPADATVAGIGTDSRALTAGQAFVALMGERFDGHAFLPAALEHGAGALVVSRLPDPLPPVPVVLVEDTLTALGDLAAWHRRCHPSCCVLAVTGSAGKTTVKEMTAAILSQRWRILKTEGNRNNLIGLPLTLLGLTARHRAAVLEMGMNRPGEIARLAAIADPALGCITNVQPVHLEGLGDLAGVARAKEELFANLRPAARLVVNLDDPLVRVMARRYPQAQLTFGLRRGALIRATRIRSLGRDGVAFTLDLPDGRVRVRLAALGRHNVTNALAAAALAHGAGCSPEQVATGLAAFRPHSQRLEIRTLADGRLLMVDCYNAAPGSMAAALATVAELAAGRRAVAILGDMLELGPAAAAAHRQLGEQVAAHGFAGLLACGQFAETVVAGARAGGLKPDEAKAMAGKEAIVAELAAWTAAGRLAAGDWLLVKGSRGMRMETIVTALTQGSGEGR
ncbi:MAG: UDP-N-acetylmuramoyl-tripeptide--D-alanyl-D-alanine ligase [Thermodesulfobacteriota bacterium]